MKKTIWRQIVFLGHNPNGDVTKVHLLPIGLQRPLLADLAARKMEAFPYRIKEITENGMDQPGMIFADRPFEDFDIAGLQFWLPCEDVLHFLERIKKLTVRTFADGTQYYKLHSWANCLVLRPEQKVSFEAQLVERVVGAEQRASAFYADKRPAHEVLREAAAKIRGVPVERIPDLTGPTDHRNDRFFPKERGQA